MPDDMDDRWLFGQDTHFFSHCIDTELEAFHTHRCLFLLPGHPSEEFDILQDVIDRLGIEGENCHAEISQATDHILAAPGGAKDQVRVGRKHLLDTDSLVPTDLLYTGGRRWVVAVVGDADYPVLKAEGEEDLGVGRRE